MQVQDLDSTYEEGEDFVNLQAHSPQGRASDTLYDTHPTQTLHDIHRPSQHTVFDESPRPTEPPVPKNAPGKEAPSPAQPDRPAKRLGVGWLFRRVIAFGLIGLTLGWLTMTMVFPITSHAVVNARVVQVRSPIDGTARKVWANLGDAVTTEAPLFELENSQVNTTHLGTLTSRRAELTARQQRLDVELDELSRANAECRENCDRYKRGRLQLLKAVAQEGNATFSIAKYQLDSTQKQLQRLKSLSHRDAATTGEVEIGQENESVAKKRVEREQAALLKTDTEIKALDHGIFLQQETPYLLQRADELKTKIALVRANLEENRALLAANTREIEEEQMRIEQLTNTTGHSPVGGIVWTRPGNAGQLVKQNELMYEIADTSTIFVEAYIHQRHLSGVTVGSQATIILTGGKAMKGRVRAIRTPGLAESESSTALRLPNADLKQVRIIVGFEGSANDGNLIGRHARVLIQDENPGPLQRSVAWLFWLIGG